MKLSVISTRMVLLVFFLTTSIFAADFGQATIKMGPLLHFNGQNLAEKYWEVSALYLLKHGIAPHPRLTMTERGITMHLDGVIIGSKLGYDFVKYEMAIRQYDKERTITYSIPGHAPYQFSVPALGQKHEILAHSCNGYQRNKDRLKVGGITPMWAEVNKEHREQHFHIQVGLGDQIYADGLVDKEEGSTPHKGHSYGVFALPSLQTWLKNKDSLGYTPFTQAMATEIEHFYFDHYVAHFNIPEFKEAMATIPMIAQPDDHDVFDGDGSYPDYLQEGFVMAGIRHIGRWYAFTVQHQIVADQYLNAKEKTAVPYNFFHVINDGEILIAGVDTRTVRDGYSIVHDWESIFSEFLSAPESVEHIIVVLGVPVVYPSSEFLEGAYSQLSDRLMVPELLSVMPLVNAMFAKNAFGLFELADDLRDSWGHQAHHEERNMMIAHLQEIAVKKNVRISLLSGDVHLGGIGLIAKEQDSWASDTIPQIITSPIGNITVKKHAAHFLGNQGCLLQPVGVDAKMCLVKPLRVTDHREKKHALISHRNFLRLHRDTSGTLHALWNSEASNLMGTHKKFYYQIPKVSSK